MSELRRAEQGHQEAGGSPSPPESALLLARLGSMRRSWVTVSEASRELLAACQRPGPSPGRTFPLAFLVKATILLLATEAGLVGVGL